VSLFPLYLLPARIRTFKQKNDTTDRVSILWARDRRPEGLEVSDVRWLVATTKPHRELWAAENCHAQGFVSYRPMLLKRQRQPTAGSRSRFVAAPLFPAYLFIQLSEQWPRLLNTFAVTGVIRYGDNPAWLPDKAVQQLRQREINGIIQLPKPEPGQRVHIVRGSFIHHDGLFAGMASHDRVKVLLDVLGRRLKVFVPADAVQLAA
jgi:transcriptional antiterminator RfaH